jgi:uncharacterized protein YlxW (UPF0749 family)
MKVEENILVKELEKRGYDKDFKNTEEDEESSKSGFEYLLRLQVRTFTAEKVKQLENEIKGLQDKLDNVRKTSEKEMWLKELKEFETEYNKWLKVMESEKPSEKPKTKTK